MRQTDAQRAETAWFTERVRAANPRARIIRDPEGWPMVPGRLGQVEWGGDRERLTVFTTHMRVVRPLLEIPGVQRWLMGDAEARMVVPAGDVEILRRVLGVIRARVRRVCGNLAALARARELARG